MNRRARPGQRVVFIDRDGVVNLDDIGDYIKTWKDFQFLPGVLEGIRRLKEADFFMVIISNQAGIGDGVYEESALQDITRHMEAQIHAHGGEVGMVYYCVHGKKEDCACRKPKVGLFEQASRDFEYDLSKTFFVGDKLSDIEAGKNYGLRTIMVLTGYGEEHQKQITEDSKPDFIVRDFDEVVNVILRESV